MINILGFVLLAVQGFCNITVIGPSDLRRAHPNPIKYGLANFGVIPYGKTIKGTALADNPVDACSNFQYKVREGSVEILVADRGNCSFVVKARVAQNAGYALILIVDNIEENPELVILGDDGQGSQIKIPCLIISKADGQGLIDHMFKPHDTKKLKESSAITISIDFPTNKRNYAHLHMGLALDNDQSFKFLHDFHRFWEVIKGSIKYDLLYNLYTCDNCIKTSKVRFDSTEKNCLGGGLYCSYSHYNVESSLQMVDGREMVHESLRQLCILSIDPTEWWKYMGRYHKDCFLSTKISDCSQHIVAKHLHKITQVDLDKCVSDSFKLREKFDITNELHLTLNNTILQNQMKMIKKMGLKYFPGANINNVTFWGTLNGPNVFEEVCTSLNKPPGVCMDYEKNGEMIFQVQQVHSYSILNVVIVSGLVLTMFFITIFFFYRRYAKKRMAAEMGNEVNQMVSSYIQFSESQKK